jgi:sepiapterin reductase
MGWQWGEKTFCVISGASRGLGRELAIQFSQKFASGSVLLLLSRTLEGLEKTKTDVLQVAPQIKVVVLVADLSDPNTEQFPAYIQEGLRGFDIQDFQQAIIIHNAGSIVHKYATELKDVAHLQSYFNVNLISTIALNTAFLDVFNRDAKIKRLVINISSLLATVPLKQSSLYCTGKAARQMFFSVCAAEDPSLLVLNYSPGPLDTDMWQQVMTEITDPESKATTGSTVPLQPSFSTAKLITLLDQGTFKSGDNVEVYDIK